MLLTSSEVELMETWLLLRTFVGCYPILLTSSEVELMETFHCCNIAVFCEETSDFLGS